MDHIDDGQVWRYLFGDRLSRWAVIGSVVGLLGLASVAFLLGMGVRLYEFWGWLVIVPGTAIIAGILGAGFVPTVGSLWLISLWGYAFPPLVGYLTGEWMGAGRYTSPRMLGFAYGSARAELLGGLETSVNFGLALAVIVGTTGYVAGSVIRWMATRMRSA